MMNDADENFGPTTLNVRYCRDCQRNRVTRGQELCIDCRRQELDLNLMTRDDSQRRAEYQTPDGHTMPQVTVPLMGGRVLPIQPVQEAIPYQPYQAPQAVMPTAQPSNLKLDELRRKIDDLKKQVS